MVRGEAADDRETFVFTISPFVQGGFLLDIQYSGDGAHNVTGAGVWPTIEKAKEIAQKAATRLLHGSTINWNQDSK
jgi:hypothetical protein